jgi:excisionase family DNA binding protein
MMDKTDFSDLISQKEAAEIRGVSRSAINELIKRGRLKVQEIGGKKFLSRKEVLAFEGQQGKRLENLNDVKSKASKPPKVKGEK